MNPSENAAILVKGFEGLANRAYRDLVGVLTIGYGHTGLDVHPGDVWTEDKATEQLLIDMQDAANCVNQHVKVAISQDQFDALVSFTFNLGCGALSGSTLLEYVNAKRFSDVPAEFLKWNHAGGHVVDGLTHRRIAEAALFRKGS